MQISNQKDSNKKHWSTKVLKWFGLTNEPIIRVYHGYGHTEQMVIYGHVLRLGPLPRKRYSKGLLHNTVALLRMFFVKPYNGATVHMEWDGIEHTVKTDTDGFFRFCWQDQPPLLQGWHEINVILKDRNGNEKAKSSGAIYIPYDTQYGFISDIDDTFLISHSANLRKRLYVLFTHNARSRKPFEGVVKHYQLLAKGNTSGEAPNPFFYVSSSEWNLYDYILEFTTINGIPRGVFLLNVLKPFSQLFKTGQNNHHTKFMRIVRIMEAYPSQRFILLGDSSQMDPFIYASIVEHFPNRIHAVYIRDVHPKNRDKVVEVLNKIETLGVPCCFFEHSEEAILHSKKIGLIGEAELAVGS
jgi:phosphatidate phosphatase APP1